MRFTEILILLVTGLSLTMIGMAFHHDELYFRNCTTNTQRLATEFVNHSYPDAHHFYVSARPRSCDATVVVNSGVPFRLTCQYGSCVLVSEN